MKTYSVKQIAEMLGTNPETVRRWIRDGKLTAVQVSRKDGNIVTENDLNSFLQSTPKYAARLGAAGAGNPLSPAFVLGMMTVPALAIVFKFLKKKNGMDERVILDDFKDFLNKEIVELNETVSKKRALIEQTESEIKETVNQIKQYQDLLENDEELVSMLMNEKESEE